MVEINNKTRAKIDIGLIKLVAEKFLKHHKINRGVSVAFVGDRVIRRLNRDYRGKDKVTDILSFADDDKDFLGEIIIDYAQIRRQARRYSKSEKEELIFILVHGLLHLIGYDDKTKKQAAEMERLGERFISRNL